LSFGALLICSPCRLLFVEPVMVNLPLQIRILQLVVREFRPLAHGGRVAPGGRALIADDDGYRTDWQQTQISDI
jgi:hypothetical protein